MLKLLENGIYNYISRSKKLKLLLIILIFLLLLIFIYFSKEIFSDQNLHYYIFSTIVQGFLTLVALLGAVVIYKLQIIETEANQIKDSLVPFIKYYRGAEADTYSWIEMMNESKKILDNKDAKNNRVRIEVSYKKLNKLLVEKGDIRSKMVDFTLISFVNISFALISLPLSKLLVVYNWYVCSALLVLVNVVFSIFSLIKAWGIIRIILGYSFKISINN